MEFDEYASKMLSPQIGRGWFNLPKGKYLAAVYAEGYSPMMKVIDLDRDRREVFALKKSSSPEPHKEDFHQLKIQILDQRSRMPIEGAFVVVDEVPNEKDILLEKDVQEKSEVLE